MNPELTLVHDQIIKRYAKKSLGVIQEASRLAILFSDYFAIVKPAVYSGTKLQLVDLVPIWGIVVIDVPDTETRKFCFLIRMEGKKEVIIGTASQKEKDLWISKFEVALKNATINLSKEEDKLKVNSSDRLESSKSHIANISTPALTEQNEIYPAVSKLLKFNSLDSFTDNIDKNSVSSKDDMFNFAKSLSNSKNNLQTDRDRKSISNKRPSTVCKKSSQLTSTSTEKLFIPIPGGLPISPAKAKDVAGFSMAKIGLSSNPELPNKSPSIIELKELKTESIGFTDNQKNTDILSHRSKEESKNALPLIAAPSASQPTAIVECGSNPSIPVRLSSGKRKTAAHEKVSKIQSNNGSTNVLSSLANNKAEPPIIANQSPAKQMKQAACNIGINVQSPGSTITSLTDAETHITRNHGSSNPSQQLTSKIESFQTVRPESLLIQSSSEQNLIRKHYKAKSSSILNERTQLVAVPSEEKRALRRSRSKESLMQLISENQILNSNECPKRFEAVNSQPSLTEKRDQNIEKKDTENSKTNFKLISNPQVNVQHRNQSALDDIKKQHISTASLKNTNDKESYSNISVEKAEDSRKSYYPVEEGQLPTISVKEQIEKAKRLAEMKRLELQVLKENLKLSNNRASVDPVVGENELPAISVKDQIARMSAKSKVV